VVILSGNGPRLGLLAHLPPHRQTVQSVVPAEVFELA
jgi:hypothetical protein